MPGGVHALVVREVRASFGLPINWVEEKDFGRTCNFSSFFSFFLFFFFLFSSFFFEDRTAPRQRGLSRKVVSGKGLKQKSELLSKCPFFSSETLQIGLLVAEISFTAASVPLSATKDGSVFSKIIHT